jgi:hypothetical protein
MPWGGARLGAGRPRGSRRSDGPNRRPPRAPRPLQPREILGVARPSGVLPAAARRERAAAYAEVVHLARTFSVAAIECLGELIQSEDERVRVVAAQAILDRAYGRPLPAERPPSELEEVEAMSPEERRREVAELTRKAAAMLGWRLIEGEADDGEGEADTADC